MRYALVFSLVLATFFVACTQYEGQDGRKEKLRSELKSFDRKIVTAIDSAFIDSVLHADSLIFSPFADQLDAFYSNRSYKLAWYGVSGLREHAGYLMQYLDKAEIEGVKDTFPAWSRLKAQMDIAVEADSVSPPDLYLDLLLTTAFFWYAEKAWSGLPEEKTKALGWFLPRYHLDKSEWLNAALQQNPKGELLTKAVFRQYYKLRSQLETYDSLSRAGGWEEVWPKVKTLRAGDTDSIVPALAKSLFLHGDLPRADPSNVVSDSLVAAIKRFQFRHGMKPDGVAGSAFFRALNVPVEERISQILLNMERSRWMPSDYPGRYLIVNIPDFSLYGYDDGKQIWTMNVVVGKLLHETVTFSGKMKNVVFNPYWVVPSGILYKEVIPGVRENRSYLRKHNMEIVDRKGEVVTADNIDWSKYSKGGFPYTIRQVPGKNNSLGRVKFLFPNSFSIYLHDTPSRSLFQEEKRAFSHGCVRVDDPEKLANYVLAPEGWSPDSVRKALKPGKEKWVSLKNPVPVFIVYFTAWVEEDGQLHFRPDVYGRDERLKEELLEMDRRTTSP
jgi:murein L,D-transpeptidase YcbB/YkuD